MEISDPKETLKIIVYKSSSHLSDSEDWDSLL